MRRTGLAQKLGRRLLFSHILPCKDGAVHRNVCAPRCVEQHQLMLVNRMQRQSQLLAHNIITLGDPSVLPVMLQHQAYSPPAPPPDDELFRNAVERFMMASPTRQPRHEPLRRAPPRSTPTRPTATPERASAINGDEAWVALRNEYGLKETGAVTFEAMPRTQNGDGEVAPGDSAEPQPAPAGGGDAVVLESERITLVAQIAALRMNLASSAKTNQSLLHELKAVAPGSRLASSYAASSAGSSAAGTSATGIAAVTAQRRRRAVELASAEQRRRVELRAARATADRALLLEQRHAATLSQQMEVVEQGFNVSLRLMGTVISECEEEMVAAHAAAQLQKASAEIEGEADLHMQAHLYRLQLAAADEHLTLTAEVRAHPRRRRRLAAASRAHATRGSRDSLTPFHAPPWCLAPRACTGAAEC